MMSPALALRRWLSAVLGVWLALAGTSHAGQGDWAELDAWLLRIEAGEASPARPPAGLATHDPGQSSVARLRQRHARRLAEFDAAAARDLPAKARERLTRAREAYEAGQGRLLRIVRELEAGAASGLASAGQRAAAAEAREILQKLALASRRQPLSGELKVRAPALVPPALTPAGALAARQEPQAAPEASLSAVPIGVVPDRIQQLADQLDSPLAVYEYVRNLVAPELYLGAMKGPLQTLLEASGNDADTASLLVAMLRAKGVPARYARGTVRVEAARLRAFTGAATTELAVRALERAGLPHDVIPGPGGIAAVRMGRMWAEAYVPYANYRGAPVDAQGKVWLSLDPGFKELEPPSGVRIGPDLGLAPEALADEYLAGPRPGTLLDFVRERVTERMAEAGRTYDEALNGRDLVPETLGLLPNALPYLAEGSPERSFDVPDALRHRVRVRGEREEVTLLDETLTLADVMGRRLTLAYVPFDEDDARTVAEFGGLAKTPPYLVEVKPVLKSGGVTVAAGEGPIGAGVLFDLRIELVSPGGTETIENPVLAGNLTAIGLGDRDGTGHEAGSSHAAAILARVAWTYLARWNRSDEELARLLRVIPVRPTSSVCMVMSDVAVEYAGGDPLYPVTFEWKGVAIDADLRSSAPAGVEERAAERDFLLLSGLEGSVLEGRVLEDVLGVESVSTAEVLQLAALGGIPVLELTRDNVDAELARLALDPVVEDEVRNGAGRGFTVRLPEAPVTRLAWTGVGYRILDPTTAEAAYQLHGGHSGGVTAPSTLDWPSDLRDTLIDQGEEPAPEGAEVARIEKFLSTDFQEGFVDEPLERPFRVLVTDEQGQRVPRASVTFAVLGGDGALLDPVSGTPAGSEVTVLSNDRGEAEATLRLGKSTFLIPRFACFEPSGCSTETESYATQVGLNVVTAHAGPAILSEPFYSYGKPDDRHPDGGRGAYLNITTGFDHPGVHNLRVITLLSIYASDPFRNPISNFPVRFAYKGPPIGDAPPGWVRARPRTEDPGALLKLRDYKACSDRTLVVRKGECAGEAPEQVVPSAVDGAPVYPIAGDSTYSGYLFDVGTPSTPDVFEMHYGTYGTICSPACGTAARQPLTYLEASTRPFLVNLVGQLVEAYPPGSEARAAFATDAVYEGYVLSEFVDDEGETHYRVEGDNTWTRVALEDSAIRLDPETPGTSSSGAASPTGTGLYEGTMTLSSTPRLNTIGWEFRLVPEEIPYDPDPQKWPDVDRRFVNWPARTVAKQKYPDRPRIGNGRFSLWGVKPSVLAVRPSPIRLAGEQTADKSLVDWRIEPAEYADLLLPWQIRFDLKRNDEPVLSATAPFDDAPFEIPFGMPFPPGDYTGHLTLADVSPGEDEGGFGGRDIESGPFPIQACTHLEVLTPLVSLPLSPGAPASACETEDEIRFRLCEASRVVVAVNGLPLPGFDGVELDAGEYRVAVPEEIAEALEGVETLPFEVLAVTVQEPLTSSRADGQVARADDLVTLARDVVSLKLLVDPVNQTVCAPEEGVIEFLLCDSAKVTLTVDGRVLDAPLDGAYQTIAGVSLEAGYHRVDLPPALLSSRLSEEKPFRVSAVSLDDPRLQDEKDGLLRNDVVNRSVLPVGRTFVKGVDIFDGHLVQQEVDISLPGRHLGLQSLRSYSSSGQGYEGAMGAGWGWNYDASLYPSDTCGLVSLQTADGSSQVFRVSGSDFVPQKGYHGRLVRNGDGSYDYFDKANVKHHFVQAPRAPGEDVRFRLDHYEEPHGDQIQLTYDPQGRVSEVAEAHGGTAVRRLLATWVNVRGDQRLKSVEAAGLNLRVEYEYDAEGNLVKAVRRGGNVGGPTAQDRVFEYVYSVADFRDRHQLLEARDPNRAVTRYEYYQKADPFPGQDTGFLVVMDKEEFVKRVVEFPRGAQSTSFAYDFRNALATGRWQTTVADPRGTSTRYVLNGNGSPLEIHEAEGTPEGRLTRIEWAATDIFKERETDGEGRVTTYGHDPNGNLVRETVETADFGLVETRYTYHPVFNKQTSRTDALDRTTIYTISDANGDLLAERDPEGNRTEYGYDGAGQLTDVTDPRRHTTTYAAHDSFGNPTRITDPLGNVTTRQYDLRGRLFLEEDTLGRRKRTTYDGHDRPVRVEREAGGASDDEVTETAYFPGGQVRRQANPNQALTITEIDGMNRATRRDTYLGSQHVWTETDYDGNSNPIRERDRRGVVRRMEYDRLNRLTRMTIEDGPFPSPRGEIARYGYDRVGNRTFEVDLAGQQTDFEYDGLYNLKTKRLPESGPGGRYEERYVNDEVGNRRSLTDPNGHRTTWEYDGLDRVRESVRDPGGLNLVTTATYADPEGSKVNKTEEFDAQRKLRTLYVYDELNRETKRTVVMEGPPETATYVNRTTYDDGAHSLTVEDPRGFRTTTRLDGLDREAERTVDPGGLNLVTITERDGLGNRKRVQDPRGNDTLYAYDGLGRLVLVEDAERKVARYAYDGEGNRIAETDRRGVRREMEHDNVGRLARTTLVPSLTGVEWSQETEYRDRDLERVETGPRGLKTTVKLDRMGRETSLTDPDGKTRQTAWDGVNKTSESDKRGNVTRYEYDAINRLRKTIDPAPFDGQSLTVTYEDTANRVVELDRRGLTRISQHDSLGRLRSVTRSGVPLERHDYDGNGNRIRTRDAEDRETTLEYDAANRLVRKVEAPGTPIEGAITYVLDENGNVEEERDARTLALGGPFSVRRTFDRLNRVETETDAEGNRTVYGHDPEGNRTLVQEPNGQSTRLAYDELGKLIEVVQPSPGPGKPSPLTTYAYDRARNRVRQTDANGHVVAMTYDRLDRLETTTQDPEGLSLLTRHRYDPDGREDLLTDANAQTVESQYDELGRMKLKTYAFAAGDPVRPWRHITSTAYEYDPNNNPRRIEDRVASGTDPPSTTLVTQRGWDSLDRLESETTTLPEGQERTVVFGYYANGLRRSLTDPQGLVTEHTYDERNRLQTTTTGLGTPEAATTTCTYLPDSLRHEVVYPSGLKATYSYDKADRLLRLTNIRGPLTLSAYAYSHDANGNRLSQIETNGGSPETTAYTYDLLNRLETVTYPADAAYPAGRRTTYEYDGVGNRVGETTVVPGPETELDRKTATFDNANRLLEVVDSNPAESATFEWDRNGNQIARTAGGVRTLYRYDVRDKLAEVQDDGAPVPKAVFQYDGEGRLNKKIGEEGLRQYLHDQTSRLLEYDGAGLAVAKYEWGSDRLVSFVRFDEPRRYFSFDALGSVTALSDAAGAPVARYHLDTWGDFRFASELDASRNRFAFTGHVFDQETKLYNAKARYFDPRLGRFLTQDAELGRIDEPPSLHRYLYALARPTSYVDLDGWEPVQVGHVYVIRGIDPDTGEAVSYTGSTIQQLKARFSRHKWLRLIQAKGTTIDTAESWAEPDVAKSGRGTLRSAKTEAVRSQEEVVRRDVAKEPSRPLNKIRAATEEHATEWQKAHNASLRNPSRLQGEGPPRIPGAGGAAETVTEAVTEVPLARSAGESAVASEAAAAEAAGARSAATRVRPGIRGSGAVTGAFAGLVLLDALNYAREENAAKYVEAPHVLEDEGGSFIVEYGREGWFSPVYQKRYVGGGKEGSVIRIDKDEFRYLKDEAEALYGKKDFWGNWVPGKLRRELPVQSGGPEA